MNIKNRRHLYLGQTKYCKQCRMSQPEGGGFWVKINNGKNRIWLCAKHRRKENESLYTGS